MSVRPRHVRKATTTAAPVAPPFVARDLLDPAHPAHEGLVAFLRGKQPTVRQARAFLSHPQYRGAVEKLVAAAAAQSAPTTEGATV